MRRRCWQQPNPATRPATSLRGSSTFGASLGVNYYVPLFWGIWSFVGVTYEVHPYKYKDLDLNYNTNLISESIGAAYAF